MFMNRAVNPGLKLGLEFSVREIELAFMIKGKVELCFVKLVVDDDG
jgi:hypothetical protein